MSLQETFGVRSIISTKAQNWEFEVPPDDYDEAAGNIEFELQLQFMNVPSVTLSTDDTNWLQFTISADIEDEALFYSTLAWVHSFLRGKGLYLERLI